MLVGAWQGGYVGFGEVVEKVYCWGLSVHHLYGGEKSLIGVMDVAGKGGLWRRRVFLDAHSGS